MITRTGKLPAGTYYVIATAELFIATGNRYGLCFIAKGSALGHIYAEGGALQEGNFTTAETAVVTVTAGDTLDETCLTGRTHGSVAVNAGILAIRVLSSSNH